MSQPWSTWSPSCSSHHQKICAWWAAWPRTLGPWRRKITRIWAKSARIGKQPESNRAMGAPAKPFSEKRIQKCIPATETLDSRYARGIKPCQYTSLHVGSHPNPTRSSYECRISSKSDTFILWVSDLIQIRHFHPMSVGSYLRSDTPTLNQKHQPSSTHPTVNQKSFKKLIKNKGECCPFFPEP